MSFMHALCCIITVSLKNEKIAEEKVASAIEYARDFQPAVMANNITIDCKESEGNKIRILTRYFDPMPLHFLRRLRVPGIFSHSRSLYLMQDLLELDSSFLILLPL